MIAFWICFVPFVGLALLAALAEVAMKLWPATDCQLQEWREWYD